MAHKKIKNTKEIEEDPKEETESPKYECTYCHKDDFANKGALLNHYRIEHKKINEETLDEMAELRKIMVNSGAKTKIDAVINLFSSSDPDDMSYLAYALGLAAYTKPMRNLILEGWKKYLIGQGKTPLNLEKISGPTQLTNAQQVKPPAAPGATPIDEELAILEARQKKRLLDEEKERLRLQDELAKARTQREIERLKEGGGGRKGSELKEIKEMYEKLREENKFEKIIAEQRAHTDSVVNALKDELKNRDEIHRREIDALKRDKEENERRNKLRELEEMIGGLSQQLDKRDMATKNILTRFAAEVKEDRFNHIIESLKDAKNSGGFADQIKQLATVRDTLSDLFDSDGKIKKKEGYEKIFDRGLDIANKLLTKDPNGAPQQFPSPGLPTHLDIQQPIQPAQTEQDVELKRMEKERLETEKRRLEIEKEKLQKMEALIRSQKKKEADETIRARPGQDKTTDQTGPSQDESDHTDETAQATPDPTTPAPAVPDGPTSPVLAKPDQTDETNLTNPGHADETAHSVAGRPKTTNPTPPLHDDKPTRAQPNQDDGPSHTFPDQDDEPILTRPPRDDDPDPAAPDQDDKPIQTPPHQKEKGEEK